ncbi:PREDICTED: uncharacterized protein LOC104826203 [Tarenaya hassleriana]|uniref:uncharacterized protein LOC104826203 n=1 Tax=Tarenaya hassleriana TaxID=28532 RepID=UPI00053C48F0|nr:PREDICTED: uncharacterized protein LOC104826203 [Tarenaya hassleriana]XP_010557088.1 PREDICTED: uncharacterized protein LOC104826203 [Tarenaya hassleriana]XP_010557089.1 PREDICTED: uncharacterized protein LOC104826203 [Tarenaya hassleriana]XP_010557090.1 PREDICTED: uncharacterized protein LOC104826203 [Tarenaya hassleriana]XP_010557091.1 PREDICTED: uncharacterized protein LOC104826203 [Tarenaya hassleriana]XP_010557092.1 PREDICTED: uncharacterized protein LOC104826203 [Tarenaya hassleriana]
MASPEEAEYQAFLEKVKRTVCIDILTPNVTESVFRTAFDQFGIVKSVQLIPNYLGLKELPMTALVEMESESIANAVIGTLTQFPFMVGGMPRPVRARAAKPEMFNEHPKKPRRQIFCRWIEPSDPDLRKSKELKRLVHKHSAEASFLLKNQLLSEEKLAQQQFENLKTHYKKYSMIDRLIVDRVAQDLAGRYNIKSIDDR